MLISSHLSLLHYRIASPQQVSMPLEDMRPKDPENTMSLLLEAGQEVMSLPSKQRNSV
jgi:hypothetical protein